MPGLLAASLSTTDWLQVAGLAVNVGLLLGLIWELRASAQARRNDTRSSIRLATIQDWRTLSDSIRELERTTYVYFGRKRVSVDRATEFEKLVAKVSEDRQLGDPTPSETEASVIHASEAMRSLLNDANSFAIGVDAGAYDRDMAFRLAGWRLANVVQRYWGHIELMRRRQGSDSVWAPLEEFVEDFVATQDAASNSRWRFLDQDDDATSDEGNPTST